MLRWSSSSASLWLWLALSPALARHTLFFVEVFRFFVTTTRLLRRFRRCPGRLLCGRRVAAPSGRHCPGRGLLRLPLHRRAAGRSSKTHDICIYSFSFLRSKLQVVRGAAAPGCCPVVLRRCSRDTPQTRCVTFVWHHSVMRAVISLLSVLCRFWVLWSSHAVRFCSHSGVGSASSRQHFWQIHVLFLPRYSLLKCVPSPEVHLACRCAAEVFF